VRKAAAQPFLPRSGTLRICEVYSDPGPDGYRSSQSVKRGQDVPVVIDGIELGRIAVADVLP
jgi:hypothetical protein